MREWIFLFLIFFCSGVFAIQGVSPGSYEINFEPGLKKSFDFNFVLDDREELVVEGDLKDYVVLSKEEVLGREDVSVEVELPASLGFYGVSEIWIVAGDVRGLIKVNIPYPDKYLGVEIRAPNVNVGDNVKIDVDVLNLGKVDASFTGNLVVYYDGIVVDNFVLLSGNQSSNFLGVGDVSSFNFLMDGGNYSAGDYLVVANVNCDGERFRGEDSFRVGEFELKILNYTRNLGGDVEPFEVEVESLWNDKMNEVFAEVRVRDGALSFGGFDSSIVSLAPWGKAKLVGFFDTSELEEGSNMLNIDVHYDGKVESRVVEVFVSRGFGWWIYLVGFLFVGVVGFFYYWFFVKSK